MDGDGRSAFLGLEGVIHFRGKVDGCATLTGNGWQLKGDEDNDRRTI
jgi:hypothetical protein